MRFRFVLFCVVLLACVALASTAAPPDLSGHWNLEPLKSKGDTSQYSALHITQHGDQVDIQYFRGAQNVGNDVFTTDGRERSRGSTRLGVSYAKARWDKKDLVVTTRTTLDESGNQTYSDTERWSLSPDGKTLTLKSSDTTLVFTKEAEEQP